MTDPRYAKSSECVFSLKYHIVWCSKYRVDVLVGNVAERLEELLLLKAQENRISIESLEISSSCVRLTVSADPTEAPQRIANQFKGYTSRILRQEFPHLRSRIPTLWSRSYYVESIGAMSKENVNKFIDEQNTRRS